MRVSGYVAIVVSHLTTTFRSVAARPAWLAAPITPYVAAPGVVCGRCHRESGAVSLLTSGAIYYQCDRCQHRWAEPAATRGSRVA